LAAKASALAERLQQRNRQTAAEAQRQLQLRGALSQSRQWLEQLELEKMRTETAPAKAIVVESYPTPLSRTVEGHETHFQLRDGLIARIPLDKLVEELKADALRQKHRLLSQPEFTATVGPLDGFWLRYTFQRHDITPEIAMASGRSGSYAQLKRWTLIPAASQLGETVEVALAPGSDFHAALSKLRPQRSTVTIWVYPDGFDALRPLKKELYRLGFAVAIRPLPQGMPIAGSPDGSRSAAQ
jgi:hypothetical protein